MGRTVDESEGEQGVDIQEAVFLALDLTGTFVFAVSGVLLAARRGFDITGGLVLGTMTGIGGGMIRDVLLDRVPNALGQPIYLAPPLIATLLIYLIGKHVSRARSLIVTFDAIGLAIFSVTGTTIALGAGATYPAALLMGALTACGGGLMRDAVASENPAIFTGTDLYLIPALFGAGGDAHRRCDGNPQQHGVADHRRPRVRLPHACLEAAVAGPAADAAMVVSGDRAEDEETAFSVSQARLITQNPVRTPR